MPVIYVTHITRAAIQADRSVLWVFGDNLIRRGLGGQAKECRGEINAIGIPTKKLPTMAPGAFFTDDDIDVAAIEITFAVRAIEEHLAGGGTVKFPAAGVGTGLADLKNRAPQIWTFLNVALQDVGIRNGPLDA